MKQRPKSHVIDTVGTEQLKQALPKEWVVREYRPDYGIDFDVEVFDFGDLNVATSLGEHFFVQLKSRSNLPILRKTVFGRYNVEKQSLTLNPDDKREIEVIPFEVDVSDLQLARSMGPALPVLLVLCDVNKGTIHFLCLNDFVDKIIIPTDPAFEAKPVGRNSRRRIAPCWLSV